MIKNTLYLCICLLIAVSCKEKQSDNLTGVVPTETVEMEDKKPINTFTNGVERAHQMNAFLAQDAVQYDFTVAFGGNTMFDGTIIQKTDGSMIVLKKKDGSIIFANGNEVYSSPEIAQDPMTRFHAYTWSYFFALPYKLSDQGTQWSDEELLPYGDMKYPSARLTFENGVGDTSEDWYIVYKDPKTNVLDGVAYIVSYGKDIATAEKEPHFAKYNDLAVVDGVPFATSWSFHNWSKEAGYTDQIGIATIKNIQFIKEDMGVFTKPGNGVLVSMPGK